MVTYDQMSFWKTPLNKELTMRVVRLLHRRLQESLPSVHKKRLERLVDTASTLLKSAQLNITSLGRHTDGKARVKHKIKAVDRLVDNIYLYHEQRDIYQAQSAIAIGTMKKIDILVDWSSLVSHESHVLRASLVMDGRSITLYQEAHPEKQLGNYKVHKQFLRRLASILPMECHPTIITDAGFRTEWFELVANQGWDFEGRHLSNMQYRLSGQTQWKECAKLYKQATASPRYIGEVELGKSRQLACHMYVYSERKAKQRHSKVSQKRNRINNKDYKQYRKNTNTPWLLVTSKPHRRDSEKKVVKAYSRRMKIEHDFRDTKDPKWGIGLRSTGTKNIKRLEILLLIGSIALLMLWLMGLAAEMKQIHRQFQANTIKHRRVLSLVFLGKQVIEHALEQIRETDILNALKATWLMENKHQGVTA